MIFEYFSGYTLFGDAAQFSIDNNFTNLYYCENGKYEAINIDIDELEIYNLKTTSATNIGISTLINDLNNQSTNIFATNSTCIYDEIDEITASINAVKEVLEEKKTLELFS